MLQKFKKAWKNSKIRQRIWRKSLYFYPFIKLVSVRKKFRFHKLGSSLITKRAFSDSPTIFMKTKLQFRKWTSCAHKKRLDYCGYWWHAKYISVAVLMRKNNSAEDWTQHTFFITPSNGGGNMPTKIWGAIFLTKATSNKFCVSCCSIDSRKRKEKDHPLGCTTVSCAYTLGTWKIQKFPKFFRNECMIRFF